MLETSDYLSSDSLSIQCTVGVVVQATKGPKPFSIEVPPPDMGVHFGALLDSLEDTDVTFDVDGEVFQAHKLVLAARSPVFKAQLFGPLKSTNSKLVIEDMKHPVFKVKSSHPCPVVWVCCSPTPASQVMAFGSRYCCKINRILLASCFFNIKSGEGLGLYGI